MARLRLTGAIGLLVAAVMVGAGCGSNESQQDTPASTQESAPLGTSPATSSQPVPHELVGRWERVNKCPQLIKALSDPGLAAIAPSVVGDYFPNMTPQDLAKKDDVCDGAHPFVHSHFFTDSGAFGSLTEELEQVDDGPYEILDERRLRIGNSDIGAVFQYDVNGDELSLAPVLTEEMKKDALTHPLTFTSAGWSISVSYPGHVWRRVDCSGWC